MVNGVPQRTESVRVSSEKKEKERCDVHKEDVHQSGVKVGKLRDRVIPRSNCKVKAIANDCH